MIAISVPRPSRRRVLLHAVPQPLSSPGAILCPADAHFSCHGIPPGSPDCKTAVPLVLELKMCKHTVRAEAVLRPGGGRCSAACVPRGLSLTKCHPMSS